MVLQLLVVAAAAAVVLLLVVRRLRTRRRSSPVDPSAVRAARAGRLAAEQAVIARQGGQGMGQGGFGGGLGPS